MFSLSSDFKTEILLDILLAIFTSCFSNLSLLPSMIKGVVLISIVFFLLKVCNGYSTPKFVYLLLKTSRLTLPDVCTILFPSKLSMISFITSSETAIIIKSTFSISVIFDVYFALTNLASCLAFSIFRL
jgi:hypothetical protein